jgi:hypothetical protein
VVFLEIVLVTISALNYTLAFTGSPGFVGLYVARKWTMSLYYNNNACGNLQHIHSIARTHTILLYVWIVFPSSCTSNYETHVKSFYSYLLIFLAHPCKGRCTSYIYATVHLKKKTILWLSKKRITYGIVI